MLAVEFSVHHIVLTLMFGVAIVLGAVMNKTRFCTMGAVSDWVNMGHKGRLGAWLFAIAIAIAGVSVLEAVDVIRIPATAPEAFPPYRTPQFAWLRYVCGGLLFGVGMTLAGGCGSRTFVRVGNGSIKAMVVLIVAMATAYLMVWTDLYASIFHPWIAATTIDLGRWGITSQDAAQLFGANSSRIYRGAIGGAFAIALMVGVFRIREFRGNVDNVIGGAVVGGAVIVGWCITGGPLHTAWTEEALFSADPPIRVAVQSFTTISPMADTVNYFLHSAAPTFLSIGVLSLAGMIIGSSLYAAVTRRLRLERFASWRDFASHVCGAILLAVGGVLAMGCSIGQGVTGMSTLALGSLLALGAMIFGSAFTMKLEYHLLDGGAFLPALRLAASEMRLFPAKK